MEAVDDAEVKIDILCDVVYCLLEGLLTVTPRLDLKGGRDSGVMSGS